MKKTKIAKLLFVGATMCMLNFTVVNAQDKAQVEIKTYSSQNEFIKSAADTEILEDEPEIETKLKQGCVVVKVKTLCDTKYQNLHEDDWKVRAKRITKKGTKKLYSTFNIYFKVKKVGKCTTKKSSDAEKIYDDFAERYKASENYDMIVGLSGRRPDGNTAGMSYLGKVEGGPRVIVFSTTYNSEAETIQHEIGHTYGLKHCENDCVMKASGFGYLNKFCSKHKKEWKENRKYY